MEFISSYIKNNDFYFLYKNIENNELYLYSKTNESVEQLNKRTFTLPNEYNYSLNNLIRFLINENDIYFLLNNSIFRFNLNGSYIKDIHIGGIKNFNISKIKTSKDSIYFLSGDNIFKYNLRNSNKDYAENFFSEEQILDFDVNNENDVYFVSQKKDKKFSFNLNIYYQSQFQHFNLDFLKQINQNLNIEGIKIDNKSNIYLISSKDFFNKELYKFSNNIVNKDNCDKFILKLGYYVKNMFFDIENNIYIICEEKMYFLNVNTKEWIFLKKIKNKLRNIKEVFFSKENIYFVTQNNIYYLDYNSLKNMLITKKQLIKEKKDLENSFTKELKEINLNLQNLLESKFKLNSEMSTKNILFLIKEQLKLIKENLDNKNKEINQLESNLNTQLDEKQQKIAELTNEINQLESNLNTQLDEKQQKIAELEVELKTAKLEKNSLNDTLETLNNEIEFLLDNDVSSFKNISLTELNENLNQSLFMLKVKIQNMAKDLDDKNRQIAELEKNEGKKINKLNNEINLSKVFITSLQDKLRNSENNEKMMENLQRNINNRNNKIAELKNELNTKLDEKQQKIAELTNEIKTLQEKIEIENNKENQLNIVISQLEKSVENLQKDLDDKNREINQVKSSLNTKLDEKQQKITELTGEIESLQEKLAVTQNDENTLSKKITELELTNQQLNKKIAEVELTNHQLNEKIAELELTNQQLNNFLNKISEDLFSEQEIKKFKTDDERNKAILGKIKSLLSFNDGY
ncbi:hypothetical protein [Spiroplasma endosymbiont of Asaphidion curtum]|uniref:hypothetical protein n=1 Tax=Spiroplasma endosymbiont of Asaphidion curtum TaxID=3066281 RepID=UPI00313B5ADB